MSDPIKPAITQAIEGAYADASAAHGAACRTAARWVEQTGWRLGDEHFEQELLTYSRLDDGDHAELRAFRSRLIEERAA